MVDIKKIKIDEIKPTSYNPRKIEKEDFDKLSRSIEEFGVVDPIIINLKTSNIIGGHQRFDYLYKKGKDKELYLIQLGDIGWVFPSADLKIKDEKHEKALNLALNRISGEWEIDSLNNLLDELAEFELTDLTGFDYSLDDFEYEYIPIEKDEDDDGSIAIDYEYTITESEDIPVNETENPTVEPTEPYNYTGINHINEDTIYRNNNNIILYGKETEENIEKLLGQTIPNIGVYPNLKLVKTVKTPINYYITDDKDVIIDLLRDIDTELIK